jgi:hypothetical protein
MGRVLAIESLGVTGSPAGACHRAGQRPDPLAADDTISFEAFSPGRALSLRSNGVRVIDRFWYNRIHSRLEWTGTRMAFFVAHNK